MLWEGRRIFTSAPLVEAIRRANKRPEPSDTLFVRGIPYDATFRQMYALFADLGSWPIIDVPKTKGRYSGFAFLKFDSVQAAETARREIRGRKIGGNPVSVWFGNPEPPNSRVENSQSVSEETATESVGAEQSRAEKGETTERD